MWDFISHPQVDDESQEMAAESDKEDDNKVRDLQYCWNSQLLLITLCECLDMQ